MEHENELKCCEVQQSGIVCKLQMLCSTGKAAMENSEKIVDLNGSFRFKVDAKGRVSLPSQFRKVLANDLVVTLDPHDEFLMVFEQPDFNEWVADLLREKLGDFNPSSRNYLAVRRKLKSRARDVEVDSSGRIMLAADQRETVEISKDVVIVGNTGYFEIWDARRYDEMDAGIDLGFLID